MRLAMPALTFAALVLAAGCSSTDDDDKPLTEDNIQDRVATALRDAETYTFEWTDPPTGDQGETVTTGAIEYDGDGTVENLELDYAGEQQFRLVNDTMYDRAAGGAFRQTPDSERTAVLKSWDWASAAEAVPGLKDVTAHGDGEVAGRPATEYELTYRDGTLTWWVGDDDRLLKWVDGKSEGTITDHGEPVDVTLPEQRPS